ncbi:hypothetical protein ACFVKB_33670 [Rhodococcus sp. NPDC127530]|uniref:hypothetical protein n=1 Tax=unclassified Rhodococcus (in: high G+C Gram-positive bacteria) TaxID=192944 RepID=UPI00363080F5
MDPSHPRADRPQRRRAFSAADKLAHPTAYEQACERTTVVARICAVPVARGLARQRATA